MRIQLIAVGTRMPSWVTQGFDEYARRMPPECNLQLVEVAMGKRGRGIPISRAIAQEGKSMIKAIPDANRVIALDVQGKAWSTGQLSEQLKTWFQEGSNVSLLVGGPDGLSETSLQRAQQRWSLSPLTLPHSLVRILLAEQLYRAWTILSGHPYHRS